MISFEQGKSAITATIAKIVCVLATCRATSFGERSLIQSSTIGKIVITMSSSTARNTLKYRFKSAVRLPFRSVVSEASRFGMTEPIAAPITRYTHCS